MITVFPDYYPEFKCIASECTHNCCIGWEIDIDPDTLRRYKSIPGTMGRRLKDNIYEGDDAHFILDESERCPFLNSSNLCDLILYGGEELLCQICIDHPRFRTFLPGRTEVGIGLCCEAAGKLIIDRKQPVSLTCNSECDDDSDDVLYFLNLRDEIIHILQDRSFPLWTRAEKMLKVCGSDIPDKTIPELVGFYLGLERLDESWTNALENLKDNYNCIDFDGFDSYMKAREHEYEQLMVYFIYRHFLTAYYDDDVSNKASFAYLSTRMIYLLGALHYAQHQKLSIDEQIDLSRMYSSEIEYSEENLDALFDMLTKSALLYPYL